MDIKESTIGFNQLQMLNSNFFENSMRFNHEVKMNLKKPSTFHIQTGGFNLLNQAK